MGMFSFLDGFFEVQTQEELAHIAFDYWKEDRAAYLTWNGVTDFWGRAPLHVRLADNCRANAIARLDDGGNEILMELIGTHFGIPKKKD